MLGFFWTISLSVNKRSYLRFLQTIWPSGLQRHVVQRQICLLSASAGFLVDLFSDHDYEMLTLLHSITTHKTILSKVHMHLLEETLQATNKFTVSDFLLRIQQYSAHKEIPHFWGTWRFITMFMRAYHWATPLASWIQSMVVHSSSLRSSQYTPTSRPVWLAEV